MFFFYTDPKMMIFPLPFWSRRTGQIGWLLMNPSMKTTVLCLSLRYYLELNFKCVKMRSSFIFNLYEVFMCPSHFLCSFRQRWMSSSSLGGTQCCWRARRGERPFASSCLMTPALTKRFAWTGWSATTSGCALVMSSGKTVFCLNFHCI